MKFKPGNKAFAAVKILFFSVITLFFIASCNPTKKLGNKDWLVEKNIIVDKQSGLDKAVIETYIRQKPNRKLFRAFYFHTWLYNTINHSKDSLKKIERNKKWVIENEKRVKKNIAKQAKLDKKHDRKNAKRRAKNKPEKKYKRREAKLKNLEDLTFGEKIQEIGEAAVVLDTFYTNITTNQIKKYFLNNGFFNVQVKDSIVYNPSKQKKKSKRCHVYYIIRSNQPYMVKKVSYKIEDPSLNGFIFSDTAACKIKAGSRYEGDVLIAERERIYKHLINEGFYEFAQDYVYFLVDTNQNKSRQLNVKIGIKKFAYKQETEGKDTVLFRSHTRYFINKIYTITDFNPYSPASYKDTTVYTKKDNKYYFLHNGKIQFRPSVLINLTTIAEGQVYSYSIAEETYRRLSDLKAFKNINIKFEHVPGTTDRLDVIIQMTPVMRQTFTAESEGTNTSGNLGVAGSLIYQNRNTARGAELMEVKIKGGLTAQKNFGTNTDPSLNPTNVFNTFQIGPEFNMYFPRMFFPLNLYKHWGSNAAPKTIFTSSANYQKRPEFGRTIINTSYGFQWKWRDYHRLNFVPFEASVVKVAQMSSAFQQQLNSSNDFFLKNSFIDHITIVSRMTWFYNNQTKPKAKALTYLRVTVESSGNLLREICTWTKAPKDANGRYTIAGTPFAHYWKADVDYRYYIPVRKLSRVAIRTFIGWGIARVNLPVLPYEKSFFAGGPNSVRAWKARTLGPGANSSGTNANFDKLGDIQIEGNLEYRFNLYKMLNAAVFVDAGNIWLRQADIEKPLADFDVTRFWREIGVGTGLGVRADFSFFIIRLDGSFKIHNPTLPAGSRWHFDRGIVVNFGIGYPF